MSRPYPLVLKPILKEKVWGGRALERLGKSLPPGAMVGESWEVADLDSTSADGGGGGSARSIITNGPLAGRTIADALREWGSAMLGDAKPAEDGGFPLLVKYLDARENLSVQVHPSPAYAAAHPGSHLKTESWYIVEAMPGAVIYKGIKPGVTRAAFERKLRAGESIVSDLISVPVRAGDVHHLPSGTCHALGAGVLVAEVQTPSDTTYRVYDWGRTGRTLHIDEALECIDFGPPARIEPIRARNDGRTDLVRTHFYGLAEWQTRAVPKPIAFDPSGRAAVLMCLRGTTVLRSGHAVFADVPMCAGVTALVPAACGACELVSRDGATVLEARVGAGG